MMGTMDSVNTFKPKIAFCFKDLQNNKHTWKLVLPFWKILQVIPLQAEIGDAPLQNACIFDKIYKQ